MEVNVPSMTDQDVHVIQQQTMARLRMPHGARPHRNMHPRYFRPPPPGYVLQRGHPRITPGLPPPWAHGGVPMRPGMGPRQFRPFYQPGCTTTGTRSPVGSPLVSPRGPGHPHGFRRGGPPPPGFLGHVRGPPRHRMPRAIYSQVQGSQHTYSRQPIYTSNPSNGNASQYFSAPSSPILKQPMEGDPSVSDENESRSQDIQAMVEEITTELGQDKDDSSVSKLRTGGTSNAMFSNPLKSNSIKSAESASADRNDGTSRPLSCNKASKEPLPASQGDKKEDSENILLSDSETVANESNGNVCSWAKGDSDLQQRAYKPAKPLCETSRGENKFAKTWKRLSLVRKSKRNKSEQRSGADRRGTISNPSEVDSLVPGCDKFSVDTSPTLSRTSLHIGSSSGNAEHILNPSLSPGSKGSSVLGVTPEGGAFSVGSSYGNHIRPPSTTSRESGVTSETEGVLTSGYFRYVL